MFRPLVVDAAIVRGKVTSTSLNMLIRLITNTNLVKLYLVQIVMPTHVGSFRLASRSKEQLSVEIGEPLFIDVNNVDIRDDW